MQSGPTHFHQVIRILLFSTILIILLCTGNLVRCQKIIVYFNHPVNTGVSSGKNATYLNQSIDDTLIAYINRAHYSIDIAVYNYSQSGNISDIATAINTAYSNGVKIRWIYNSSSSNSGLALINSGIQTLASPSGNGYGIMHNKFMIIDANSSDSNDAIVWTGSCNWNAQQFNDDANNVIIFQDAGLAQAYTAEFNEMWGGANLIPNPTLSKFGPYKTNNTQHIFTIGGVIVEQYFSPSDNTNTQILNAINSADDDLYFGIYTFTETPEADSIISKIENHNVYTAGILDQYSQSFTPYSTLNPVMTNQLKVYNQSSSIYHNKMMIVDPCSPGSDPLVETGSHNWTISADTKNDENTIIIHSDTIANMYYQSFYQNFSDLGGTLTHCTESLFIQENVLPTFTMYPNPTDGFLNLSCKNCTGPFDVIVYDAIGRQVMREDIQFIHGEAVVPLKLAAGCYFLLLNNARTQVMETKKLFVR